MAGIQRICERELDLEPDAGELPGILARRAGYLALVAEDEDDGEVAGVCFGSLARVAGVDDSQIRGHVACRGDSYVAFACHGANRRGWVGPVRFYARVLNARVERVYWFYRKAL